MDYKKDFQVSKEANSRVKIEGEIPFAEVDKQRAGAIKALSKNLKVDGFRAGHVPENIVVQKLGEMTILTEMAERALAAVYPEILAAHKVDAIGHPQISITKIAPDNPLGFTATVAVMPEITLPDYKKIATEVNKDKTSAEVTDSDVDKQIEDILRQKAAYERLQKKAAKNAEGTEGAVDLPTPDTVEEDKPSAEDKSTQLSEAEASETKADKPIKDINELPIPELTDELVKELGQPDQFKDVADFKAKIREHLEIEKKREAEAAHRAKLTDKIIEDSQFELPQIMIDSELGQMFAQMEEDIQRAGLKMDDYLSHMKKTREDLQKEWTPTAEKRARLQLVLNEIAKTEKLEPDQEKLDHEVKHLLEHYKDADENRVRIYVASVMMNEAVMKMLEEQ